MMAAHAFGNVIHSVKWCCHSVIQLYRSVAEPPWQSPSVRKCDDRAKTEFEKVKGVALPPVRSPPIAK
jgi:hypothetical protein